MAEPPNKPEETSSESLKEASRLLREQSEALIATAKKLAAESAELDRRAEAIRKAMKVRKN